MFSQIIQKEPAGYKRIFQNTPVFQHFKYFIKFMSSFCINIVQNNFFMVNYMEWKHCTGLAALFSSIRGDHMKTVGIIAEYNPFHNGHAYQIAKAKEMTGADYCIIVMCGDFVQRGAPALIEKYTRAETALRNGADLVLELPVYYALGSAEYFASGAVALFDKLGVTDALCFGSECGDINILSEFAQRLLVEDPLFKEVLDRYLRMGYSYPTARNAALHASAPHLTPYMHILSTANNILGIEYCKALSRRGSCIKPYTTHRAGSSYHDASLLNTYCSALAVREAIDNSGTLTDVRDLMPANAYDLLTEQFGKTFPVRADDFSLPLHYQLLTEQSSGYTSHPDIDHDLSDRITNLLPSYRSFTSFSEQLKTKNRTYTRIARSLMHILLQIKKDDLTAFQAEDYIYYARILGFRIDAAPLLTVIKAQSSIPLLSRLADADSQLSDNGRKMLKKDIYASQIYYSLIKHKYPDTPFHDNEYTRPILKI